MQASAFIFRKCRCMRLNSIVGVWPGYKILLFIKPYIRTSENIAVLRHLI